jgi:hypothetical protein
MKNSRSSNIVKKLLDDLIGKSLLQIFLEGGGFYLSWPIVFQGGSKLLLYLRNKNSTYQTLELHSDLSIQNQRDEISTKLIENIHAGSIDFEQFRVALSLKEIFTINSYELCFFEFEMDEGQMFSYLKAIILNALPDLSVVVVRDEENNSLSIHYGDNDFIASLKKQSSRVG